MMLEWEKLPPQPRGKIFTLLTPVLPSRQMDSNMFGLNDLNADGVARPPGHRIQ